MKKIYQGFALLAMGFISCNANSQISTFPHTENFDSGSGGWTTSGTLWEHGSPSASIINSANSGSNAWATDLDGNYANNSNASVESPVFDFTSIQSPTVSFYIWNNTESGWDGAVFQSSIDGGSTWQVVGSVGDPNNWFNSSSISSSPGGQSSGWSGNSSGWVLAEHDIFNLAGQSNVKFRFALSSDGSVANNGFAFDDFSIVSVACPDPSNISGLISNSGLNINWTENGSASSWHIQYDTTGFTLGTGNDSITSTNPTTFTGLQSNGTYDFYVRSICGAGDSSGWSGPFTITNCTIRIAPWVDDLESYDASTDLINNPSVMPCYESSANSGFDWNISENTTPSSGTGPNQANSGTKFLYTEASNGSNGNLAYLVTPSIDISGLTIPAVTFNYHMYGLGMGTLTVEWSSDNFTWNTITSISGQQQSNQSDPFLNAQFAINTTATVIKIRFKAERANDFRGDISLDDIGVVEAPPCPIPTLLSSNFSNADSIGLTWNPGYQETSWILEYGTPGFTPGSGQEISSSTLSTAYDTITGLSTNSVYDFYVKADCGGGEESSWVGPITHATPVTNDTACGAILVQADGSTNNYSNIGATNETGDISTRNSSVWFKTVVPASGHLAIATCGTTFDTYLNVFTGSDCSNYSTYTSIGNADGNPFGASNCSGTSPAGIELCNLTPGDTITFSVQSWSSGASNQGVFPLRVWDLDYEAGNGSQFDICYTDSINLWTQLSGQGNERGTWSYPNNPNAISNDSIFLASNSTAGGDEIYYIVSNSCMADTATVTVKVRSASSAGEDGTINACKGQQINLYEGLSGFVDVGGNWFDPSNNALTSGDIISGAIPGSYNYDYIANNGVCSNDTATVTVIVADCIFVGIEEVELANLSIFPNPTSELLYISNNGSNEVFNYSVMDLNGKVVASKENAINGTQTTEISLANIERGIYLIRIFNEQAEKTVRVVKQ